MWHAIRHTTLTDGLATSLALVHAEFKRILCTIASERLRRHSMTAIFAIAWCMGAHVPLRGRTHQKDNRCSCGGCRTSRAAPYRANGFGVRSDDVRTGSDAVKLGQFAFDGLTVPALDAYALANRHG